MKRSSSLRKVAVVSDAVYPYFKGGKEVRYRELFERLPEHGFDVTMYTMRWWEDEAPDGPVKMRSIAKKREMYKDGKRSMFQGVMFALSTFRLLGAKFDAMEADHMPYLLLFPLKFVTKVKRVPFVVTWNEVWGTEYWVEYMGKLGRVAALIEKMATRLPDTIVALSDTTADRLVAMGADRSKIVVQPAGVSCFALEQAEAARDACDLVYAGRLIAHKRVDVVIEALAKLSTERDLRLEIIGEGPEEENLVALARDLGVQDRVVFHGSLEEQSDLWSRVKGSKVFISASEREGFGLAVAEAMAAGTPVVCSDHADNESQKLVGEGCGLVAKAGDAASFATAIARLLDEQHTPEDVRTSFLANHPELTWDALAAGYASVLAEPADLFTIA